MALRSIRLQDFRCFETADLELDLHSTLIQGPNGSGKTSLLEAVFMLGRGRSFRGPRSETLVRDGQVQWGVSGELERGLVRTPIRVEYIEGQTIGWFSGERVGSLSELSTAFPVEVIDPGIHKLVEEGPVRRRRFLDWGVFHVEPTYLGTWQRFQRALRQRNAALRQHPAARDLDAWDEAFASAAVGVDSARSSYVDACRAYLSSASADLLGLDVTVRYLPGWPEKESIREMLGRHRALDLQRRTTTAGPQRADLDIQLGRVAAKNVVSRGQQKMLASGLVLGQLEFLVSTRALQPTLLLDDPAAELDAAALERFLARVFRLGAQLVLTSLPQQLTALSPDARVFHVKQGRLQRML